MAPLERPLKKEQTHKALKITNKKLVGLVQVWVNPFFLSFVRVPVRMIVILSLLGKGSASEADLKFPNRYCCEEADCNTFLREVVAKILVIDPMDRNFL